MYEGDASLRIVASVVSTSTTRAAWLLGDAARTELGPTRHAPTLLEVDHDLGVRLRPEAKRCDVPVVRSIRDVLNVLGDEPSLVGAILDTDDSGPAA
jgi:hypothetical protein